MAHALTRGSSELNGAGDDESTFGDKNAIAARCAPGVDGAGESHGPFSLHGLLQAPGHEAEPGVARRADTCPLGRGLTSASSRGGDAAGGPGSFADEVAATPRMSHG